MTADSKKKVLIFIVAYNAEKTIGPVLSRIPVNKLPPETEVLVIDDASTDRTFETANANRKALDGLKLTVLYNPENQSYGGNQKIGYQFAIKNRFDVVALLHGDGQYAPEKLPELVLPIISREAEACFGSRMMERRAALKNGMPLYKYIGNRVLTIFQNLVLGMDLSEFHSGYRVYSVAALKQLPFKYNTNDFHFDTEIIIQFAMRGFRIKELQIPTYYGDEICHVNGLSYAWNVIVSTLTSRLHLIGIFFHRKFDVHGSGPSYDIKKGYTSSHTLAISAIKTNSKVLDLACGNGDIANELNKSGCSVTGIDKEATKTNIFERFILHDLDSRKLPDNLDYYDYILALDCIEHLNTPELFIEMLREECYSEKTTLIFTTPNIGFFMTRLSLLLGQFNYGRQGILDLTHKRLFTFKSFRRLLRQEGYFIIRTQGIPAPFPKALGNNKLSHMLLNVNRMLIQIWPQMFSYQIYIEAKFHAPLNRLLSKTIETSQNR